MSDVLSRPRWRWVDVRIGLSEHLAGKLLVRSARLRAHRGGPNDAHELRHIGAAIEAGNSDPCDEGRDCHLDRALRVSSTGSPESVTTRSDNGTGWGMFVFHGTEPWR